MKAASPAKTLPGLTADEIALIKSIIGNKYDISIFGSRVTGKHRPFSDVDICLRGKSKIPDEEIAALRFAFQESNLPYQVDIVDASSITEDFRALIEETSVKV